VATIDLGRLQADIAAYGQKLQAEAVAAAERAATYLKQRTIARAQTVGGDWGLLADNIEVWSQDGRLVIGLSDQQLASQAFQLEYGDETRPPQPLFRTMGPDIMQATNIASEHMAVSFGPGRYV
jgi:hypothetical protein